jgi:hypothetical protein
MEITDENLVTTFRASRLTHEAFCREYNITLERLRYHLYKKTNVKMLGKREAGKKTLHQLSSALTMQTAVYQKYFRKRIQVLP